MSEIHLFTTGQLTALGFGLAYALLLSTPAGLALDDDIATRWIVVSGGVLLVWLAAALTGEPFDLALFIFAGFPMAARGAYYQHQRTKTAQHAEQLKRAFDGE